MSTLSFIWYFDVVGFSLRVDVLLSLSQGVCGVINVDAL